jgi:hypothetical protein
MTDVITNINCPHCGAPLEIMPGTVVVICKYCDSTVHISDKPFILSHSILPCKISEKDTVEHFNSWIKSSDMLSFRMRHGIKLETYKLKLIPFWICKANIKYSYKGVSLKYGNKIEKEESDSKIYIWKILAHRESFFPARDYDIPMNALAQYSISMIPPSAEFFPFEISETDAKEVGKGEVEAYQKELLSNNVDEITSFSSDITFSDMELVHVPIYFLKYRYREKEYNAYIDGSDGEIIHVELPSDTTSLL